MRVTPRRSLRISAGLLLLAVAAETGAQVPFSPLEIAALEAHHLSSEKPKDPSNAWLEDPAAIDLGRQLFRDARMSSHGQFSCASCHVPEHAWTNGRPMPTSVATIRKVPSLHNVAFSRWYAWDGHADTVWMQILGVMANPREFDTHPEQVAQLIQSDERLRAQFLHVFGSAALPHSGGKLDAAVAERVQVDVAKAIAAYTSTLRTPAAPFDRFVEQLRRGAQAAGSAATGPVLAEAAQRGAKLFIGKARCELCHAGPFFTDGEFHNTGLAYSASASAADAQSGRLGGARSLLASRYNLLGPFSDAREPTAADKTRYMVGAVAKWGAFKTPGLRNVARTAPYMHDGRFATLRDVVRHYQEFAGRLTGDSSVDPLMRPIALSAAEAADLVAFLDSLSSG